MKEKHTIDTDISPISSFDTSGFPPGFFSLSHNQNCQNSDFDPNL